MTRIYSRDLRDYSRDLAPPQCGDLLGHVCLRFVECQLQIESKPNLHHHPPGIRSEIRIFTRFVIKLSKHLGLAVEIAAEIDARQRLIAVRLRRLQ